MKIKLFLKIALYVLAILVFQELALRLCFPLPELNHFDRINYMMLAKQKNQYKYHRNQTWYWESQPDTNHQFIHKMNSYGFRDKEWDVEKPKGKQRMLFIGDSFVEGVMSTQDATIPKAFEKMLESDNYEVWNGGMMGAGLNSYLMLAADAIPTFQPDYVFLCLSTNDFSSRVPIIPEKYMTPEYFDKWRPRLLELIDQIRAKSPIKFRWQSSARTYLPTAEAPASPWNRSAEALSPHVTPQLAEYMKQGQMTPFRTNNLYNEQEVLSQTPNLGEAIPFFDYFCKKFNVVPVVVYIPSRNLITQHYYPFEKEFCLINCTDSMDLTTGIYHRHRQVLAAECAKHNLPFIDLTEVAREIEARNEHIYWNYDDHMRAKGYQYMGEAIYWDCIKMGLNNRK